MSPSPSPIDAFKALLGVQRQHGRLLKLSFPHDDSPAGSLLVANRLEADEGLSRDFQFTVDILSDNPAIPLKDVMGKMVSVEFRREDGSLRYFNGYVPVSSLATDERTAFGGAFGQGIAAVAYETRNTAGAIEDAGKSGGDGASRQTLTGQTIEALKQYLKP